MVILVCATPDATIHYTLDGTDPTGSSTPYSASFTVKETRTVKVTTLKEGFDASAITSAVFTKLQQVATLTITPNGGEIDYSDNITFRYTTNGDTPIVDSTEAVDGIINLNTLGVPEDSCIVKVIAIKDGLNNSLVVTAFFTQATAQDL